MYSKALLIAAAVLGMGGGIPVHAAEAPGNLQAGSALPLGLHPSVHAAADSLGMIRGAGRAQNATSVVVTSYEGPGALNGKSFTYRYEFVYAPHRAARLQRTLQDGTSTIEVVRDGRAWNEAAPGIKPVDVKSGADRRMAEVYLNPHGALRAAIDAAAGDVKVSTSPQSTTITVPVDIGSLRIVLGDGNRPVQAEVRIRGVTLAAEFSGYRDFNNYGVFAPAKIVRRENGKVVGELGVSRFVENPYVIVPLPEKLTEAASD